jgi:carnitine monooxygenase subunit
MTPAGNPLRITHPERIPVGRYYDEAFYRLERELLWPKVWQMACRLEQIPEVGDWFEYSNQGQSVVVVRTREGVKAFHNVCRHRGVQLVSGHGNCRGQGFICPFHGWGWNMDGDNRFVYGRKLFSEEQLDKADLALRSCRSDTWGGYVFINLDENARSFRHCLGPLADRLEAHGIADLRAEWWYATTLPANWKVAMEAFMEGYHVMRTHPQLQKVSPALLERIYGGDTGGSGHAAGGNASARDSVLAQFEHLRLLSEGMGGMVHPKELAIAKQLLDVELPSDASQALPAWYRAVRESITQRLQADGELIPDLNAVAASHPIKAVEFIFPHYFMLPYFSSMSCYRIRPLGPESCYFEIWSLTHFPAVKAPAPLRQPRVLPYEALNFRPSRGRTTRISRHSSGVFVTAASSSCASPGTSRA